MPKRTQLSVLFWLGCFAISLPAQNSTSPFQLRFVNTNAEKPSFINTAYDGPVQLHFYLRGKFPHFVESEYAGTWRGHSWAEIPTRVDGAPARSFAAFVYQQGCAVQYVTVEDVQPTTSNLDLPCVPQQTLRLPITIPNRDEAGAGDMVAEVTYYATHEHWIDEAQMTVHSSVSFALGSFPILDSKSIILELPDFGNDPTLNRHLKHGVYHMMVRLARTPQGLGYLVLPHDPAQIPRRLPVASHYPEIIVLPFTTGNHFAW